MQAIFLPIKPKYAQKIASGEKRYEYRKVLPRRDVSHIVVYSSSPERRILGIAEVEDVVISSSKRDLWEMTKQESGITKQDFQTYFRNSDRACAFKIKNFRNLDGIEPAQMGVRSIPQSFCYVSIEL